MRKSNAFSQTALNRQTTINVDVARIIRNFLFGIAAIIAAAKSPETARKVAEATTEIVVDSHQSGRPP